MRGIVVKFDNVKGYGFIKYTKGEGKDAFVHISNVEGKEELKLGQKVKFDIDYTNKGPVALKVIPGKLYTPPYAFFSLLAIIFIASIVAIFSIYFHISWAISYLSAINIITFCFYCYDKFASIKEFFRIPEVILHSLALFGGSPSAALSQYILRHKTVKKSFVIVFYLILIIQLLLIWKIL